MSQLSTSTSSMVSPASRQRWQISSVHFCLLLSTLLVLAYNSAFFHALGQVIDPLTLRGGAFTISVGALLGLLMFILLNLIAVPYLLKPLAIAILLSGAAASYFMNTYGIAIDSVMVQNVVETDPAEAAALFSPRLAMYLLLLGVVPCLLVWKVRISYRRWPRELLVRLLAIVASLLVIAAMLFALSQDYASFFRNNKNVRQMAVPLSYIYAGVSFAVKGKEGPIVVQAIGEDARPGALALAKHKPTLTVFVVGETGRADHFGLNGYERNTTPLLAKQDVFNFTQFTSCGTATAVSVPCMFSLLDREHYDDRKAKSQQGLLDVLNHAGYAVLWRDNNSGCKGACDRVSYEDMSKAAVAEDCNSEECFDQVLLHNIDAVLPRPNGDMFVVLHQHGSHGPDYYHRYPQDMAFYQPECKTNQLQDCSQESLINTYDNTIRYTDYFLNNVIEWLKQRSDQYNTAMLYVADHGESLGENHVYLHGMPYMIAPEEQKHVSFFYWLSKGFEQTYDINSDCLASKEHQPFSQDNIFHSVLGMLDIQTSVYDAKLDMFQGCRPQG
ncbi:phosphoethanolamine transferase [Pokkaliibacter plantistimulans]|nr:phosphoethanolamine--lipid A transferase [Pokkaliibacter plantistimulans]